MSIAKTYQILDHYQVLRVTGADSHKFLQGQLTCDLDEADGTKAVLGGYCNVQGRLHASFYILKVADDYLLILPKTVAKHLLENLSKYAVFFQTDLSIDQELSILAIESELQKEPLSQSQTSNSNTVQLTFGQLQIVLLKEPELEPFKSTNLVGFIPSKLDLMALEQIKLSIPMIESSTIEKLLPHYIGLPQAGGVNFEKGCYTGQEVVARMHYRGTLKTHPQKATIHSTTLIDAGSEILNTDSKKVGDIVNCSFDGSQLQALVSLSDKALEQSLHCNGAPLSVIR